MWCSSWFGAVSIIAKTWRLAKTRLVCVRQLCVDFTVRVFTSILWIVSWRKITLRSASELVNLFTRMASSHLSSFNRTDWHMPQRVKRNLPCSLVSSGRTPKFWNYELALLDRSEIVGSLRTYPDAVGVRRFFCEILLDLVDFFHIKPHKNNVLKAFVQMMHVYLLRLIFFVQLPIYLCAITISKVPPDLSWFWIWIHKHCSGADLSCFCYNFYLDVGCLQQILM